MASFILTKSSDGQFRFNLVAGNGQTILTSESYAAKSGATNGIESVKENAKSDERFERRTASDGRPYFVLKAGNGQVIGQSQMYSGEPARENGIESVKTNAPVAGTEDKTD